MGLPPDVGGGDFDADSVLEVEVLPPESSEPPPRLSDQSVARILELVWRDTRKVASEYRLGDMSRAVRWDMSRVTSHLREGQPLPEALAIARADGSAAAASGDGPPPWAELVRDRVPLLRWYVGLKLDQAALAYHEWLDATHISPRSSADIQRTQTVLQRRIEERRTRLWPTLRTLLLTPSMHRRVVRAAQTQIVTSTGGYSSGALMVRWRPLLLLLTSPVRLAKMWLAAMKALLYTSRWVLHEFGLKWLLSQRQRQLVRISLIERAISKGLVLQQAVEDIEDTAKEQEEIEGRRNLLTVVPTEFGGVDVAVDAVGVQKIALDVARWARQMQKGFRDVGTGWPSVPSS